MPYFLVTVKAYVQATKTDPNVTDTRPTFEGWDNQDILPKDDKGGPYYVIEQDIRLESRSNAWALSEAPEKAPEIKAPAGWTINGIEKIGDFVAPVDTLEWPSAPKP